MNALASLLTALLIASWPIFSLSLALHRFIILHSAIKPPSSDEKESLYVATSAPGFDISFAITFGILLSKSISIAPSFEDFDESIFQHSHRRVDCHR
jgi:hypothetical protein